jgi:hypothetical protein
MGRHNIIFGQILYPIFDVCNRTRNKVSFKNTLSILQQILMNFSVILFCSFITSCCAIGKSLENKQANKQNYFFDYYYHDNEYTISCGNIYRPKKNRYTYEEDSDKERLWYTITISGNERSSSIKLNDFRLTNLNDTPMVAKYFVETFTKATTNTAPFGITYEEYMEMRRNDPHSVAIDRDIWEIENLPVVLPEADERKAHVVYIVAETNIAWYKINGFKVYLDLEVGENRHISNNILYKRYWGIDCRPKFF